MNKYLELKERHQADFTSFPIRFAFSQEQLEEALSALNTTKDEVIGVFGGGIIRKSDVKDFTAMLNRHDEERTGKLSDAEYVYQMFLYELGNHEYCITYDIDDTLNACGVSEDMLLENTMLSEALKKAKKDYLAGCDY